MGHDAALDALIDEAMKKSPVMWVEESEPVRRRAFWHVWLDRHSYVVTGLDEQPDPGFDEAEPVRIVVRSKDNVHRLVVFGAIVTRMSPVDVDWDAATAALASARLNLRDAEHAPARWATDLGYAVYRITPTGEVFEAPGEYSSSSHRAEPVLTPATTSARRPWVLHKRGNSGRPLS